MWIGLFAWFTSISLTLKYMICCHDDVIKWKHFPRYWPFLRGIHRSPVNSTHKGRWRGALMFSLICAQINCWVNNREAGDLRRLRTHYDVIVMWSLFVSSCFFLKPQIHNQCCMLLAHIEAILHLSIFRDSHYKEIDSYYKDKTVDRLIFIIGINLLVRWHI